MARVPWYPVLALHGAAWRRILLPSLTPAMTTLRPLLLGALALLLGCAPSTSPLYRDYAPHSVSSREGSHGEDVYARLRAALATAGWREAASAAPNALSTEPRELSDWGLYEVLVSLDVVPVGGGYVRVHFHPVRRYLTGARTKIPYLSSGIRRAILPDLTDALQAQGFRPLDPPHERDGNQM